MPSKLYWSLKNLKCAIVIRTYASMYNVHISVLNIIWIRLNSIIYSKNFIPITTYTFFDTIYYSTLKVSFV